MTKNDCSACDNTGECPHCGGEGEIETDNNGPIVTCPVCNGDGKCWHCDGSSKRQAKGRIGDGC